MSERESVELTVLKECESKTIKIVEIFCRISGKYVKQKPMKLSILKIDIQDYILDALLKELHNGGIAYTSRKKAMGKTVEVEQLRFRGGKKYFKSVSSHGADLSWNNKQEEFYLIFELKEVLVR